MADKRLSATDVIGALSDGMTIGIGGWAARRKPMALVREICRSSLRDLTVVSFGGPDVGMLCSAGKVKRVIFGFVSLDAIPLDPHFRAARERGTIEATEVDEGMLQWGLYAAGLRLPFLPTWAGLGSDVMRVNPDLKLVTSPYGGEQLVAVPPITLDAALVHVNRATKEGVGQILGPDPYFDDMYLMAARLRFISCERIIPVEGLAAEGCVHTLRVNRMLVDGVVESPFGAHFTSCAPDYDVDLERLREYASATSDEARRAYWQKYIEVDGHQTYLEAAGLNGKGS